MSKRVTHIPQTALPRHGVPAAGDSGDVVGGDSAGTDSLNSRKKRRRLLARLTPVLVPMALILGIHLNTNPEVVAPVCDTVPPEVETQPPLMNWKVARC
jgi:hypothetical protein